MTTLPTTLYRAVQVQRLDRAAIDEFKIPGDVLMERAGAACFALLRERWPEARRISVLCGAGNNGGDGYVIARLAHAAEFSVRVMQVGAQERLAGDAAAMRGKAQAAGIQFGSMSATALAQADVIVDALLGTGLKGEVTGEWLQAIEAINKAQRPVLAVDIPSGLHADSGRVLGAAVHADVTLTFIGLKQGLFTGAGPDCTGEVRFDALEVPNVLYRSVPFAATRLSDEIIKTLLPKRARTAHKGDFGHVLIVGGDHGMSGAARMAGESAARAGAGRVSVATRAEHAAAISAARPELMCHPVENAAQLRALIARASVIAIGPGLGTGAWGHAMLGAAIESALPLVVDADALNCLATEPAKRETWVITPHPGEAARLLNLRVNDIHNDRFAAARELQERFGGVAVLKGAGTLIATPDLAIALCNAGNPGMASGGMGDVLTGVIAGFVAQGLALKDATHLGVQVHAMAADRAARDGERGLLASDVIAQLRAVVNTE